MGNRLLCIGRGIAEGGGIARRPGLLRGLADLALAHRGDRHVALAGEAGGGQGVGAALHVDQQRLRPAPAVGDDLPLAEPCALLAPLPTALRVVLPRASLVPRTAPAAESAVERADDALSHTASVPMSFASPEAPALSDAVPCNGSRSRH